MNTEKSRELLDKLFKETPPDVLKAIVEKIDAMAPEKYPELEEVSNQIVQEIVELINQRTAAVSSKNPYKFSFVLDAVIQHLIFLGQIQES